MRFTTDEIARITGGEVFGRPSAVDGASIDSRVIVAGQLFVPVVAERDGHDFIGDAVAAGAGAYLTAGPIGAGTAIRVPETAAALAALGSASRDRLGDRVVGVTGSVGKTSLKDLLASAAGSVWRTSASVGSFNNELGVPLTLCNAPDETECAVIEMGARGIGHIADLCEIARPTVGVVTAVAGVHLELFRTIEDVAEAKSELVASLPATGTAVLNADDERVVAMASATAASVLTFGLDAGEVRAAHVTLDEHLHSRFELRSPWGTVRVHLPVAGRHQVTNALGAAAAALSLGAPLDAVAEGLGGARLSAMRMDLVTSAEGFRVLDDAYNASPTSVEAALRAIVDLAADHRFAVLGTMAELGEEADRHHHDVAMLAAELGISVISVAEPRYRVAAPDAVPDTAAAVARLRELGLGDGDVVLVKGSRSAGLERVVEGLLGERRPAH